MPPYLRRTRSLERLLPWLYLKGVSTGAFEEAFARLAGYVYLWADGIYCQARLEQEKQCLLVLIGADEQGNKELVGLADGYRESEQSWLELLLDLQRRGWQAGPDLERQANWTEGRE